MGATTMLPPTETQKVAEEFTQLIKENQYIEAIDRFYAQDIVNIEPLPEGTPDAATRGLADVRRYNNEWMAARQIHDSSVEGPFISANQFALRMYIDVTELASNQRIKMTEICLYTVENGRISKAEYLYGNCETV